MAWCPDLPEPCGFIGSGFQPSLLQSLAMFRMQGDTGPRSNRAGEDCMAGIVRLVCAGIVLAAVSIAAATAQQLDPKVVTFKLPDQIVWKDNPKGGNRSAVLLGDPTKPGPYAMLLQWLPGNMSRPHFHPNDRFFLVISGIWWVGSGPNFDPGATVPVPAGSFVTHFAKGVHFDGAKDEQATILVWGEGPATSTPLAMPPPK
jgi:hypothetical protein